MKAASIAIAALCVFFVLVFAIPISLNPYYPAIIIAGESSIGTWMSGVLLVIASTVSFIIGMRKKWFPWYPMAAFLMLLALDERFMFHEHLKEHIIFSLKDAYKTSRWIYELPVMAGACIGVFVTWQLWRYLKNNSRILLLGATLLGSASVVFDVLAAGVLWEECCKLLAELLLACMLIKEVESTT